MENLHLVNTVKNLNINMKNMYICKIQWCKIIKSLLTINHAKLNNNHFHGIAFKQPHSRLIVYKKQQHQLMWNDKSISGSVSSVINMADFGTGIF